MQYKYLFLLLIFFAKIHSYSGCISKKTTINLPAKEYDLNNPRIIRLSDALLEISGISFYAKDSSVFAISDQSGSLFKIHLGTKRIVERWKFSKTRDFEDVCYHDSTFYVLESNGNIYSLKFNNSGDTIWRSRNKLKTVDGEFESLYYDDSLHQLVMLCKDCKGDKKEKVSALTFDHEDLSNGSGFTINTEGIADRLGEKKMKLKASAASINPLTGDVWILSSINQLIAVTDRQGNLKNVYTLNPFLYTQPEGITFTPWGDLIISNEAGDKYNSATLFIIKLKNKI